MVTYMLFNKLYLVLLYKVPSEHLPSGKKRGASTIKQAEPLSLEAFPLKGVNTVRNALLPYL